MKKEYYFVIAFMLLVLASAFYWYELRPLSIRKSCYNKANAIKQGAINTDNNVVTNAQFTIKRADYEKIFNDEYNKCLMVDGIK